MMEKERALESERFEVPFEGTRLVGDIMPVGGKPEILFLHGAGQSVRSRNSSFRKALAADGLASVAFDHIGHGETGGELLGDSLESRTRQAQAVIEAAMPKGPKTVEGASMGAYTALKLAEIYPTIENIILVIPGAYDVAAYNVPFGPAFSEILRRPGSWHNTDAWEILHQFTGNLLIIRAGQDEVIPSELIDRLYASADQAKSREMIVVPESGHQIYQYLADDAYFLKEIYPKVRRLIVGPVI